ncbi:MAG: hypothetical protein WAN69_13395 [Candidatus Korobacteraceae bacterium]
MATATSPLSSAVARQRIKGFLRDANLIPRNQPGLNQLRLTIDQLGLQKGGRTAWDSLLAG